MLDTALSPKFILELSVRPVIVCLGCFGILCLGLSVFSSDIRDMVYFDLMAAMVFLICWLAWYMETRYPPQVRWLLVGITFAILLALILIFSLPGVLPLLLIPVALTVMLLGLSAGLTAAGLETVISLLLLSSKVQDPLILITSLASGWLFCIFYGWFSKPVHDSAVWSWNYRRQANQELEEVRNNREKYEQSLRDLEEANIQMRALNRLAQNLRQIAENAKTAKEQFVANVSHELRTPLNMITGYTEMILNSPGMYGRKIPGALLADLGVIQRNAEHLSRLINDVLDLSQVEVDQMALSKEFVNVREVVDFSLAAVQPLFRLKHLSLESEIMPDLPLIFCDRTRLQEVLLNILSNAGRFTEQGGVLLTMAIDGDNLLVAIRDTGPGIAEADLQRLFNPFEQLDASIRRKHGGTGLGLAISKRFIEMHGGKIWVESQIGAGTTFKFTIPITIPETLQPGTGRWFNPHLVYETPDHLPKLPPAGRPRFIVVEKHPTLINLVKRYMGDVDAVSAASVKQVAQILDRSGAQAVLMNLPSSEACLQELDPYMTGENSVPVIACAIPDTEKQAVNQELAGILVKPISRLHLLETLQRLGVVNGTVLIVDDEPDALQLFARMLTSDGEKYRVLFARDGQEALGILQDCRPDVILLDLVMPNLDGFHLLEMLRDQRTKWRDIPVVLISAQDPSGHPTISSGLMIRQPQGLSVRQLITCIRAVSQVLAPMGAPLGGSADPALPKDPAV